MITITQNNNKKGYTNPISPKDILREYKENVSFRAVIDSGMFRYAEGRFVINDAKYLHKTNGGIYVLTDYAREYLDKCALKFSENFTDDTPRTIPAQSFYQAKMPRQAEPFSGFVLKKYVEDKTVLALAEIKTVFAASKLEADNFKRYITAVNSGLSFGQSISNLMTAYFEPFGIAEHKYASAFFDITGISEKLYRDWRNDKTLPSHKNIITICAGFDFDIKIAELLLEKAAKAFSSSDEHIAHRIILTACRGWSIFDRNNLLEKMGFERLTDD